MEDRTDLIDLISQRSSTQSKRKREDFNSFDESAGVIMKQIRTDEKTLDQNVDSMDQISQLPDHIIHHIITLLRCKKDIVRTSILSKRWREIWASFSKLVFDQRNFIGQTISWSALTTEEMQEIKRKNKMFSNFVDSTLQSRVEQKVSIQKFMLHINSFVLVAHIDRWLRVATESNIQELDLHVPAKKKKRYSLPQTVFAAQTVTALRVYGCKLDTSSGIKLCHLQRLCLGKLRVDEQIIEDLISSCPLIEDFRLIYCSGLKLFQVSDLLKLNRVDLHLCHGLKKVELEAPNLETFWYHGHKSTRCKISLASCKSLKSLTLEDVYMTNESFQNQLSSFPVLEKLVISRCNVLKNITISSYRLKTLVLRDCKNLKEADIDAPNLLSLEYKGDEMPFFSLNPSGLKEAKFYFHSNEKAKVGFCYTDDDILWFAKLRQFLEKFDHSKGLKLVARSEKNVIIYEDLGEIFLPPLYDLKLEIVKSSTCFEDLLDNLLRAWHPKTLSIVSSSTSNSLKIVYEKTMNREEKPSCCKYNISNNKCWRHFLEDVKVEDLADNQTKPSYCKCKTSDNKCGLHILLDVNIEDIVCNKMATDWTAWLKSTPAMMHQTTCFKLNWKTRKQGRKDAISH